MSVLEKFGTELTDEKLLALCRLSESAERYEDMCAFVSKLVQNKCNASDGEIDEETRNLLSVAFKNVVGAARASWRTLNIEEEIDAELLKKYKGRVEKECRERCDEVLKLLDDHLLPKYKGKNNESEVFFAKMAGDYYRYLAEFSNTEETAPNANEDGVKAKEYYDRAMDVAKEHLPETHPTRLGLALNFSVCYYEILKEPEKACEMAKNAFDAAINKLDTLNDASYKDSTLIMQLLRDNLTLWTSANDDED